MRDLTNAGNEVLTGVSVTDTQALAGEKLTSGPTCQSLSSPAGTCSGSIATLLPGQVALFTGTYTVTSADLTAGQVRDTAVASGTPSACGSPAGAATCPPVSSIPSTLTVPAVPPVASQAAVAPVIAVAAATPAATLDYTGAPVSHEVEDGLFLALLGAGLVLIANRRRRRTP
jgi:hypothetical protein